MAGCGWRARRSSSRALAAYGWLGGPWLLVIPLLLLPDVSVIGYLRDPRVGAFTYNLVHNWAFGLGLLAVGLASGSAPIEILGTVAIAHTGMDRAVGLRAQAPDVLPGHPPRPHGQGQVETDRLVEPCGSPGLVQRKAEPSIWSERT